MNSSRLRPRLALVIPCHNEEDALERTIPCLIDVLNDLVLTGIITDKSYILLCDDGSDDSTWSVIANACKCNPGKIHGISLSANRGQQIALFAGLEAVQNKCDIVITMDADLQDPPSILEHFIRSYQLGNDVVLGVRSNRKSDSILKRFSASFFYRCQSILGIKSVSQHGDCRLLSNQALSMLLQYRERNLYLRGLVPELGLNQAIVDYSRAPRCKGKTKYRFSRMLALSADGITSFSARPIRWIILLGCIMLIVDLIMTIYVMISYLSGNVIQGWTSLILSVWFLGSLILIAIGLVGEYVGKIYIEVKNRPIYFIKDEL